MADGIPRILRWKFSKRPDKGAIIPFLTESEAVVQQLEPSAIELGKPYYEGLMVFDDLFSEGEDIPGSGERADNRDFLETILMLSVRTMRMLGGTFLVLTKMSMQDTLLHHQARQELRFIKCGISELLRVVAASHGPSSEALVNVEDGRPDDASHDDPIFTSADDDFQTPCAFPTMYMKDQQGNADGITPVQNPDIPSSSRMNVDLP
ncbi:hypothetical protein ACOSQ3_010804 [Xanthoceras sorbifolium]